MENKEFDKWWRENYAKLITIYNEEIDLNIAVMEIAEAAWRGAKCRNKKRD